MARAHVRHVWETLARRALLLGKHQVIGSAEPQHVLSLPFFVPMYPAISSTFASYLVSPPLTLLSIPTPPTVLTLLSTGSWINDKAAAWRLTVPSAMLALLVNVVTQGLCIRGVNRLTSVSVFEWITDELIRPEGQLDNG